MKVRLKIYFLWFALCASLSCFAESPPVPPGYTEDPDAWLYELEFPMFSTQSPKGNELDPLAKVPASTKTTALFSVVPETRRNLSLRAERIPLKPLHAAAYNPADITVLDLAFGSPDRKLVWNGERFTNVTYTAKIEAGATIHAESVLVLKWNQETNDLSEVEWSDDLKSWQPLNHVLYTGQWTFEAADTLTGFSRFYRLKVQPRELD